MQPLQDAPVVGQGLSQLPDATPRLQSKTGSYPEESRCRSSRVWTSELSALV